MGIPEKLIPEILVNYKNELEDELAAILLYWAEHTLDHKKGGFYGAVDNYNKPNKKAPKGIVLTSRILWTFSAATLSGKKEYQVIADRAFNFIKDYFLDTKYGGVFWSVAANGQVLEDKKQIYGLAFCIYGLSEYYKLSKAPEALRIAIELFALIERYSNDKINGGYVEAFTRKWDEIGDLRLSEKDENERKTMNTHLHIIEAYANLYEVWNDHFLRERIKILLGIFHKQIIDPKFGHLNLFMDEQWNVKSSSYSFGHDIEASWLLLDCANRIKDAVEIKRFKKQAILLSEVAIEGLDVDGALFREENIRENVIHKEKFWWSQAEAMIGFYNAWQITGDSSWLYKSVNSWDFIKIHLKDVENGEWFWGIDEDGLLIQEDKVGFWKCPYHNARACMEIIKRIDKLNQ